MKEIIIKNKTFYVDDNVYDYICKFKYNPRKHRKTYYAKRSVIIGKIRKEIQMSSDVWFFNYGTIPPMLDHKNGNGWDNRIENLRLATPTENSRNKRKTDNCKSKYKGVSFNGNYWPAYIRAGKILKNGRHGTIILGNFNSEIEAAEAYDIAAIKYFGEFAKLNFQRSKYEGTTIEEYLKDHKRVRQKTSKYANVNFNKRDRKWIAQYKHKHIGSFDTEEQAFFCCYFVSLVTSITFANCISFGGKVPFIIK